MFEKCSTENLCQLYQSNSFSLSEKWNKLFEQCLKTQTSPAGAKPRISALHGVAKLQVSLSTATNTACTVVAPLLWERWGLGHLWGWRSTGTGCPGRLWSLLLWRYSRPAWTGSCAASCRWPCFVRGVGLDDPQRSLPTPTILWFCEEFLLCLLQLECSSLNYLGYQFYCKMCVFAVEERVGLT